MESVESSEDAPCRSLTATSESKSDPGKFNTRAANGRGRQKVLFLYVARLGPGCFWKLVPCTCT